MKTQTVEGTTVLSVNFTTGEKPYLERDSVRLVKIGRRVRVTTNDVSVIRDCLAGVQPPWYTAPLDPSDIDNNVEVGPKTLARLIENALLYGHSRGAMGTVDSDYNFTNRGLLFERKGPRHLGFTAPCGAEGRLTNGEAWKLVAALRSL